MKRILVVLTIAATLYYCDSTSSDPDVDTSTDSVSLPSAKPQEPGFDTVDISSFLSNYLLIGNEESLLANDIRTVDIKDYSQYELNKKAQVVVSREYDSDVYVEFRYTENGMLESATHRLHSQPNFRHESVHVYSENGELTKVINIDSDSSLSSDSHDTISDPLELAKFHPFTFRRAIEFNSYYLDKPLNRILTYRNTIVFGSLMMTGQNELAYYLNPSGLIDSLLISGIDNDETVTFYYEHYKY